MNKAWQAAALTAAALLAWLRLLALDGALAKAEPKTLRYRNLHAAGRLVAQRPPALPQDRRCLALGTCDRGRLETRQRPGSSTLTSTEPSQRQGRNPGPVEPPATRPASRAPVIPGP